MWIYFAVPVLLFILFLLVFLSCWCVIKRGRGGTRTRHPQHSRQTTQRATCHPQHSQQTTKRAPQQQIRKFTVANSKRSPATVFKLLDYDFETTVGNRSDVIRNTDVENNPLQESADKPATKRTMVQLGGRLVLKLIEALSGQSRRQLDQTPSDDEVDRVETASMIYNKTEIRPEEIQPIIDIKDVKYAVSCLRHCKDGTPSEEIKPNLRCVTFACP